LGKSEGVDFGVDFADDVVFVGLDFGFFLLVFVEGSGFFVCLDFFQF
jgi:hypothetical protein